MTRRTLPRVTLAVVFCLLLGATLLPGAQARSNEPSIAIHLRRATFDPLTNLPNVTASLRTDDSSQLRLVQIATAPDETTEATLEAAGLHPLLYIPDNTYLVRVKPQVQAAAVALRWSGRFEIAYKLPATLDPLLSTTDTTTHTLRLIAAPDTDAANVAAAVLAAGGSVLDRADALNGNVLRVTVTGAALRGLLQRDDVLWVEPTTPFRLLNDKARAIMSVTTAQQQYGWLNGAGQIVAVLDTGLDVQSNLSADFSGRVAATFTPQQMDSSCTKTTWSDLDGHGTHVSGSVLGSGALSPSGTSFAGVAPGAKIVVEALQSDNDGYLRCFGSGNSKFLKAYNAGARIQNLSLGSSNTSYDDDSQVADDFMWQHKDHLIIVAAGNEGTDSDSNGVIDNDSIGSPATAKNVLSVGASENDRPPTSSTCDTSATAPPADYCYKRYAFISTPFANDFISNNPAGIAAFSSRGPTNDGRLKPEIVAPGSNIISTRTHASTGDYGAVYNSNYAYLSGTSMASPLVAGSAALVRQWLAHERNMSAPSAALVKALLLNGATNIAPGQYGTGAQREIPAAWPNNVEGWGRASVADAIGLNAGELWIKDETSGLTTGKNTTYTFDLAQNQSLHVTLTWTDYPGSLLASKALVNDLDLEVQAPNGSVLKGNVAADMPTSCRSSGADRCNTTESVDIGGAQAGIYTLRVRGATVVRGPQPFALVAALGKTTVVAPSDPPVLQGASSGATIVLSWTAVVSATRYEVQRDTDEGFANPASTTATTTTFTTIVDMGTYALRVRGCNSAGCGPWSNVVALESTEPPRKLYLPLTQNP